MSIPKVGVHTNGFTACNRGSTVEYLHHEFCKKLRGAGPSKTCTLTGNHKMIAVIFRCEDQNLIVLPNDQFNFRDPAIICRIRCHLRIGRYLILLHKSLISGSPEQFPQNQIEDFRALAAKAAITVVP